MPPGTRYPIPSDILAKLRARGYDGPNYVSSEAIFNDLVKQYLGKKGDGKGDGGLPEDPTDGGDGGSSGGSSGSGGSVGPDLPALRAHFAELLRSWGLGLGQAGLENLVNHAASSEWTTTEFLQAVRRTAPYKRQFPGIDWRNGQSEGQYNAEYKNYVEQSRMILGRGLTRQQFGTLQKKGSNLQDWQIKLKGIETIYKRKDLFNWYEQILKNRGQLKPKEQLSKKEIFKIVIGQDSQKFETVYQEAWVSSNLGRIGITVGKKGDFTRTELSKLIRNYETGTMGAEVEKLGAKDWAELADQVKNVIPLSKLYKSGVTERDLVTLKFGGKGAGSIAERVETILSSYQMEQEDDAQAQLVQTGDGKSKLLTGGVSRSQGY